MSDLSIQDLTAELHDDWRRLFRSYNEFYETTLPAETIEATLAETGINISVSRRPSTRIDMENRGLEAIVRASVHYYNTDRETDRLVEEIENLRT